ncbi:hypothetical protein DSM112329_01527 [Paraconexibacter sp. AEG42_29]|uniref:Cellulase family glycosylhydrolase n=1 Tax=Paraconexibacter sp. AEG42_29 TaxID=2997339 RepID=A0AAU7ASX6_9ACTN
MNTAAAHRRPRLLVAVVLVTLAALTASAAVRADAARAATPAINVTGLSSQTIGAALATGAKYIRLFVDWNRLEPDEAGQYPTYRNTPNAGAAKLAGDFDAALRQIQAGGARPILAVLGAPGWGNGSTDHLAPPYPDRYAEFFTRFVQYTRSLSRVAAYEVWNEPDAPEFWHGARDPNAPNSLDRSEWKRYGDVLRETYKAAKPVAGDAAILMGPTTGGNHDFVAAMYEQGLKGSFDGIAVHTTTACLRFGPDFYVRNGAGGPINQYSFLSYRSVRAVMLANNDPTPQIWMTELGWSSTDGGPTSCERGGSTGKSPSGVSEAQQAELLTQAYGCLARDPYVAVAAWFTMADSRVYAIDELNHYGLVDTALIAKPALAAFRSVVAADGGGVRPCGDFTPPTISVLTPAPRLGFTTALLVRAMAVDAADPGVTPAGVTEITYRLDDGEPFYRFTEARDGEPVALNWNGAAFLADGPHTLKVDARDALGNVSSAQVPICKGAKCPLVPVPTKIVVPARRNPACVKRTCSFKGQLTTRADTALYGRVRAEWQVLVKRRAKSLVKGRARFVSKWVTLHRGGAYAVKPFVFRQKLRRAGTWRVRAYYDGASPLKETTTKFVTFRVK